MWPNSQETADLVTFTEEIFSDKLHYLCSNSRHVNEEHILKVPLRETLVHDKAVDTWEIVLSLYVEFSSLCNVFENVLLFSNLKKFPWCEKNKVLYISNFKTRLLLLEQKSILYMGVMGLFNILI